MKARHALNPRLVAVLVFVGALAPAALAQSASEQSEPQSVNKEVSDVVESLQQYSIEQKEAAVEKAKAALDELDAAIGDLETSIRERSSRMSESARTKANAALDDLRKQREQLAEWYDAMEQSSRGAWNDVKQGFSESYSALRDAWNRARAEFDEDA